LRAEKPAAIDISKEVTDKEANFAKGPNAHLVQVKQRKNEEGWKKMEMLCSEPFSPRGLRSGGSAVEKGERWAVQTWW